MQKRFGVTLPTEFPPEALHTTRLAPLRPHRRKSEFFQTMYADYNKPFLTLAQQLELLKQRGMTVSDVAEAEQYLRHAGYYRLSSYWHVFRQIGRDGKRIDDFTPGSDFSGVVRLYEFDKDLRTLLLSILRVIEISVRVAVAHRLGEQDIYAHENPRCLSHAFTHNEGNRRGRTWYESWLDKYRHLLTRSEQEDFVREFIAKYGQRIPIWVAIEIWDFGLLSKFFAGMKFPDQKAISELYGVSDPHIFSSWLRTFNYVRNVCAHHSRLWNRNIIDQPRMPAKGAIPALNHLLAKNAAGARVYATLATAAYTVQRFDTQQQCVKAVRDLFSKFPNYAGLSLDMTGTPKNWAELELWQS